MASDSTAEQCQMVPSGLLTGIKFDILSGRDMEKFSTTTIIETADLTDAKLGLPNASNQCANCGSGSIRDCDGHFGLIKLPVVTYHPYFVPEIVHILNQICPGCKSAKQDIRRKVASSLQNNKKFIGDDACDLDAIYKSLRGAERKLLKIIRLKLSLPKGVLSVACFKRRAKRKKRPAAASIQAGCKYCARSPDLWYPHMKFKILPVKINGKRSFSIIAEINEKPPRRFRNRNLSDVLPKDYWNFVPEDPQQQGAPVSRMIMSPSQVFYLLKQLDREYIKRFVSRRELLFLPCLTVTPNSHRVMEVHSYNDGPRLVFDERTKAFKRLSDLNRKFDECQHNQEFGVLPSTHVTSRVLDCLNMSRLHTHQSLNEDSPSSKSGLRWLKEIFLSKRTDNAFRMTVVGDPKLRLDEIGVPWDIAENMLICEHVNAYNLQKLNRIFTMQLLSKEQIYVRRKGKLVHLRKANQLQVGDTFYRPLEDGDVVLINRNPSVHQHSLIAFSVKVLPSQSVFSINPLCCAPFNGDFDGDCLHGFVPQSLRCRVELGQLVALDCQLLNSQDGQSLLSLTHDSLTAAHLITGQDRVIFFNKFEMQQLAMLCPFPLPLPAILKAPGLQGPLWTGQQLFSMLLPEMTQNGNGGLYFPDNSRWLQNGSSGIFSNMFRCYGKKALDFVFAAQDALCECLSMSGFSVSLSDLYLSPDFYSRCKMIDEVSLGLEEAKVAAHIKKLLLDLELGIYLTGYDESEDSFDPMEYDSSTLNSTQMIQASISAFKDVFHDIQHVVHQHISNDNSMLAMVHAGSKGSLLKLVQQGACVGLQVFPSSRDKNFDVVRASFLDGLNPLECFSHALSSRGNMFSAHAELPGTLTRKLMFYMRDLYVAYDGTVRNAFDQQIVQFSYDIPGDTSTKNDGYYESWEEDIQKNALGGHAVGSVAACAVSEAAYGALDHPINSLESSPLMNLKKVLECSRSSAVTGCSISVILSDKLRRRAYGFEYGALEVKKHLEPVIFSDVVNTVMIVYAGCDPQFKNCSPWAVYFHVNKDKMMRKGLTLNKIINELLGNYEIARQRAKITLPSLCIIPADSMVMDEEKEYDDAIPIAVKLSDADIQLDTIRDALIPMLLQTLVKGLLEFKRVDILWDYQLGSRNPDGELFVKVFMSEHCVPGMLWSTLVNACLPIMELIDWTRSHPDNVHDVSDVNGIDTAWKYFFGSLKSAMSDTGRKVHQEHLRVVADRLSVTGQFSGLSRKGLKLKNPTPFNQAAFSNPSNSFIKAAKEGSVDHLCGTIDAMAWGKEAPIGTGGPFEIMYSGEVPNIKPSENIYETLSSLRINKSQNAVAGMANCDYHPNKHSNTQRFMPNSQTHLDYELNSSLNADSSFANLVDMSSSLRRILHEYPIGGYLNEADKSRLIEAIHYHPRRDEKMGSGIQDITVGHHPSHQGSRCFFLARTDGTSEDISYRKCVLGAAMQISPKCARIVGRKLYNNDHTIPYSEQKWLST
ncbi:DNA-directed RNA polymerase IV subunit 1 isoform X1 [Dioscorea cayenensis subsp. rotundata]|uniref:DNA-directed RNA polymerase n=1 Tax=Dioscorea cayennensis subsp. rotundata TaxID=55577 RepID=A0AB40ALN3_DIOCR|nr:DNA-directed RNA polymerase IV subunit 1 isoform X1 [Dioscorea cayenensis subsp. rotundata]XP_039115737.1 DNA-directed RNA polymerase IV subunit 1 isoform X1 [Dioscorea cayenensis subsp. rotundata]